jgi:hypothetical protein
MNTEFIIGTVLSVAGIIVGIFQISLARKRKIIDEIVHHLIEKTINNDEKNVEKEKFRPIINAICEEHKYKVSRIKINKIIDKLIYEYQRMYNRDEVIQRILNRLYLINDPIRGGGGGTGTGTGTGEIGNYKEFFQRLLDELREKYAFTNAKIGQNQSWYLFPSGVSGFSYGAAFVLDGKVRVKLHIDTGKKEKNKQIYNTLFARKESIEQQFGEELTWEEFPDNQKSSISIYKTGTICDDAKSLEDIHKWMIERLLKMKKTFNDLLPKVKNEVDKSKDGTQKGEETKRNGPTVYQCLKNVYDKLDVDREYTVEEIKGYLSKEYEIQNHKELKKVTRDLHVLSAIVNNKNRPHEVKIPLDEKMNLFYYPDENNGKIVKKFHLGIKDDPTIYWKENKQKMSKRLSEIR